MIVVYNNTCSIHDVDFHSESVHYEMDHRKHPYDVIKVAGKVCTFFSKSTPIFI